MTSIHNALINEAQKDGNSQLLNEMLTKTLVQARKDLKELARLKKKELGPKSALYAPNLLDDVKNLADENNNSKDRKTSEMRNFIKKSRIHMEISDLQFSDNQAINQLTEQLVKKENELRRKTISEQSLKEIFSRSRNLIEHLWEEMHTPEREATDFSKKYFYPETIMNYIKIFQEISRLSKIRSIQHEVLASIERREAYIQRLKEVSQQLMFSKRRADSFYDNILITDEVPDIIQNLRVVTIDIVVKIIQWREKMPKKQPFIFNSQNYVVKMRNDLDFLKLPPLGPYLEKTFPLEGNPLFLPMTYINDRFKSNSNIAAQSMSSSSQSLHRCLKLVHFLEEQGEKFIEDCIRADRVIFVGEEKFLNDIMELEVKNKAATKIQCFVRCYMAKKILKHLKRERRAAIYERQAELSDINQENNYVPQNTIAEEQKELADEYLVSLLENSLKRAMIGCEGRYSHKIFEKKEEDD
jgi:hypothetical protein